MDKHVWVYVLFLYTNLTGRKHSEDELKMRAPEFSMKLVHYEIIRISLRVLASTAPVNQERT